MSMVNVPFETVFVGLNGDGLPNDGRARQIAGRIESPRGVFQQVCVRSDRHPGTETHITGCRRRRIIQNFEAIAGPCIETLVDRLTAGGECGQPESCNIALPGFRIGVVGLQVGRAAGPRCKVSGVGHGLRQCRQAAVGLCRMGEQKAKCAATVAAPRKCVVEFNIIVSSPCNLRLVFSFAPHSPILLSAPVPRQRNTAQLARNTRDFVLFVPDRAYRGTLIVSASEYARASATHLGPAADFGRAGPPRFMEGNRRLASAAKSAPCRVGKRTKACRFIATSTRARGRFTPSSPNWMHGAKRGGSPSNPACRIGPARTGCHPPRVSVAPDLTGPCRWAGDHRGDRRSRASLEEPSHGQARRGAVVRRRAPLPRSEPRHDQEYFSDGITEDIIDALSRVPNLRVVARTSAFAFKGKANDVRQIGRQLDVNAVLEGSVRKDGDQLRITAQLNRVSDGTHLWSHTFDRQLRDIFAVQHEISQAIAGELRAGQVPDRRGTSDLEAWQRYQEARYFFNRQEPASYYKAIERYQQAINRDPRFALAYAGMADSYAYLAENFAAAPKEVMPKARAAAETAVSLDENSAEAHISRGIVNLDYEWNREAAQREFLRALQLNPASSWAHHWYAHSLETQGRLEEATKEMRAALALDPLSVVFYWDLGNDLLMARRNADALALLDKGDELFPNFWILNWEKAEAYYAEHDLDSLHRELEKMQASSSEMGGFPPFMAILGKFAAHDGRTAEARRILDRLESLRNTQYVEPAMTVELAAALGDRERVKVWLQRSVEERSTLYLYLPLASVYIDHSPEIDAAIAKMYRW